MLPFALVRLGPDIAFPQPNSGYRPRRAFIGFSHTRLEGSGGCARYGNIRVMPIRGEPRRLKGAPFVTFPATDRQWSIPIEEESEIGRYRCRFSFGVEVELSSTARTGVHRYRFTGPGRRFLLIDFAAVLQNGAAPGGQIPYCEDWEMENSCTGGTLDVLSDRELTGSSEFVGGWGHFEPYFIFSFLRSREPFVGIEIFDEQGVVEGDHAAGRGLRVLLIYPESCSEINLEVGISFSGSELAQAAVETESKGHELEVVSEGRAPGVEAVVGSRASQGRHSRPAGAPGHVALSSFRPADRP